MISESDPQNIPDSTAIVEPAPPPIESTYEPIVRWWEPVLCWVIATLILLTFVPNIMDKLNPVTGDEPFYLMTAISLIQDHDLDEINNYGERDYWQFAPSCQEMSRPFWGLASSHPIYSTPGILAPGLRDDCPAQVMESLPLAQLSILPPHVSKDVKVPGIYTKHGIGLSVLIAPFFALGGRTLVVVFLVMLTALLGVNLWLLAFETTGRRFISWLTWAIMMLSAPLICFAFLIFPAAPAGLLVVYSWRRLRLSARAQQFQQPDWQPNTIVHAMMIGLSIGVLPWLHSLYLSLSFMLVVYWLGGGRMWRWWRSRPRRLDWRHLIPAGWSRGALVALFLPMAVSGLLFISYYVWLYGSPIPNTQDHAGFANPIQIPFADLGLLFDQKYGLLIYAPIYLIAMLGLWIMVRRLSDSEEMAARRSDFLWLFAVSTPYLLIISDYNQWWGEWCPPARYLMPTLPLLAVPLSLALAELRGIFTKGLCYVLAFWSVAIGACFMYNPHLMFNWQSTQTANFWQWIEANAPFLNGTGLGQFVPSFVTNLDVTNKEPNFLAPIVWILIFLALALTVVFLQVKSSRKAAKV